TGEILPSPDIHERVAAVKQHLRHSISWKGEKLGILDNVLTGRLRVLEHGAGDLLDPTGGHEIRDGSGLQIGRHIVSGCKKGRNVLARALFLPTGTVAEGGKSVGDSRMCASHAKRGDLTNPCGHTLTRRPDSKLFV
ncbi:MAG: hypothetical protein AAF266_02685, partial [Planctomycetota bacterium]